MRATEAEFVVGGQPVRFYRSWWTGSAWLQVEGQRVRLQSPYRLGTHFNAPWRLTKKWRCDINGHSVEIVRHRKMFFSATRASEYAIAVDGEPSLGFEGY